MNLWTFVDQYIEKALKKWVKLILSSQICHFQLEVDTFSFRNNVKDKICITLSLNILQNGYQCHVSPPSVI